MVADRRFLIQKLMVGLAALVGPLAGGCGDTTGSYSSSHLDAMQTGQVRIANHTFDVWLALTDAQRQRGLMQVKEEQLAARAGVERGMLFAFDEEDELSFWMLNTIIPLDIAYISSDGVIVRTYTMAPLETRLYPSGEPAQFALEVKAGLFEQLGIGVGDVVELPGELLKTTP